jgi:hypothetical protein
METLKPKLNQTLFSEIGDKYLTDIDLTDLDHIYNKQNVIYSCTQSQSFYYYPLIDQSQNLTSADVANIGITEFVPAVYIKKNYEDNEDMLSEMFNEMFNNYTKKYPNYYEEFIQIQVDKKITELLK